MSWRPTPEQEEQVEVIRRALAQVVDSSGMSRREVDRRAGWTENYLSQILRDAADLKVTHIVAVLGVLGIKMEDFFAEVFKRPVSGPSGQELVESLAAAMKRYEMRLSALEEEMDKVPRRSA